MQRSAAFDRWVSSRATDYSDGSFFQVPTFDLSHTRGPFRAIIDDQVVTFENIEQKFDALAKSWKKFNRGKSVINYAHYSYFQIVAFGWSAIPFLLEEVANGDGTWYVALQYIVGEMAESREMHGDPAAIRTAWLDWGHRNGYGIKSEQA